MKMCLAAILLVVLLAAGCGGDSSSPSAPPPTTVSGQWSATATFQAATPAGNCVSDAFNELIGQRFAGNAELNQSGSTVTATVVTDANTCDYRGTISGRRLSMSATRCQTEVLDFTCRNGTLVRLTTLGASVEGLFDPPLKSFDGTLRTVINARNNVGSLDITLLYALEMRR